jgi:hypothetical protein
VSTLPYLLPPTVSRALIIYRQEELLKGKLALEHTLGLGAKPNVIPWGEARIDAELRTVEIGWHPVAGLGGKWLAENIGLFWLGSIFTSFGWMSTLM